MRQPWRVSAGTMLAVALLLWISSGCRSNRGSVAIDAGSVEKLESGMEAMASSAQEPGDVATGGEPMGRDGSGGHGAEQQVLALFSAPEGLVRASELLTFSVDDVGAIEDLVVNLESGQILYIIVEDGSLVPINPIAIAVPLSALDWQSQGTLQLTVDATLLDHAPLMRETWPDATQPIWDDQIVGYWQQAGVSVPGDITQTAPVVRASTVVDSGLADFMDVAAGTVEDLLVDLSQGRAKYVLATLINEPVVVPFSAFDFSTSESAFIFDPDLTEQLVHDLQSTNLSNLPDSGMIAGTVDDALAAFWESAGFDVDLPMQSNADAEDGAPIAAETGKETDSDGAAGMGGKSEEAQAAEGAEPRIVVADQEVNDGAIVVAHAVSTGPGWIVISADQNGAPGPVIGYAPVDPGVNREITVMVGTGAATQNLHATLHRDAGTVGTYEFPRPDTPITSAGRPVSQTFAATGAVDD